MGTCSRDKITAFALAKLQAARGSEGMSPPQKILKCKCSKCHFQHFPAADVTYTSPRKQFFGSVPKGHGNPVLF